MTSSRQCPAACCGKFIAVAALLLVPVAAVVAFSPWTGVAGGAAIASDDAPGLNLVEPASPEKSGEASTAGAPIERQAQEWTFTDGPRPSSNR